MKNPIFSKYIHIAFNSPTLMTWGSFLTRSLSLVVVLPLILTRLTTEEIALWYLFMTIISFQLLFDIGFSPTFSRVIAYAKGGTKVDDLKSPRNKNNGQVNWKTIELICATMRNIYSRIGLLWTGLLLVFGTLALIKPISLVSDTYSAWAAWGVIIVVSTVSIRGNIYSSYLQGINKIALLRRWEAITSLSAIATSFLVLILGGGLLGLVIAHQGWRVLNILRNRWLSNIVEEGRFKNFAKGEKNEKVMDAVWPSAWRSGVAHLMGYGLVQASGILYAQIGTAASIASYLLALRLIRTISRFSQAPFYSKFPVFNRLYAENKKDKLLFLAKRGMRFSYWCYIAGFIGLGIAGDPILRLIGSNADFPSNLLWSLIGLAFFVERYGAMHLQLYSVTNHIVWHIANGITGLIYIIVSLMFIKFIDMYAFPLGFLIGNIGFYSWYSAKKSYNKFKLDFMNFEKRTILVPACILICYIGIALCLKK
jgi:O-antigen/teichoic acid export membrane protein